MLLLSQKLQLAPIMSLQTGAQIAQTTDAVIDPASLQIVAYRLKGARLGGRGWLLLTRDIREISDIGIIVDSSDELVGESDVIKIQKLLKKGFKLIDMPVVDETKKHLGKVEDYTFDSITFTIHQLHVKRPLLRSLQTSSLIIRRTQITAITPKAIVVQSASLKEKPLPAAMQTGFSNPFRGSAPRPQTTNSDAK